MSPKARRTKLGARIAASRLQRGLSQTVVARRARIAPSYLSRIETGKVHPTVGTAERIAVAMRMSLGDLVGPSPTEQSGKRCPVSPSGHCLMDLIVTGSDAGKPPDSKTFTPRQLRLLRRFAAVVQRGRPKRLRFLEGLLSEVLADQPKGRG